MRYTVAAFLSIGAIALGVVACGGRGSVSQLPVVDQTGGVAADGAAGGGPAIGGSTGGGGAAILRAGRLRTGNLRAAHVFPGGRGGTLIAPDLLRAPRLRAGITQAPIADEALQIGHAYPKHEHWSYSGLDPSCGQLDWTYTNTIPGVTVTVDPTTTALDGVAEVSFSTLPDDVKPGAYANLMTGTCTNPKATGRGPGPTSISVAAVSLDIATVPQDNSDGTIVTNKTFTTFVGKFQELDASPEPEVTLLQNTWKLPGDTIKTYTETKAKASVEMLDAGDLGMQALNFYWIHGTDGKALQVPLSVVFPVYNSRCAPGACSGAEAYWGLADAEASVNVIAPTVVAMTSTTGAVASDARDGVLGCLEGLHFGYLDTRAKRCAPAGAVPGISWRMTARVPFGGQGQLDATQLIRRAAAIVARKGAKPVPTADPGTRSTYELDTCLRHGDLTNGHQGLASGGTATYAGSDTPGLGLSPNWSSLDVEDAYVTDFVYKPADIVGTTPDRVNIWVSLGTLSWSWSAIASNAATGADPVWRLARSAHATDPSGDFATPAPLPTWAASYGPATATCPPGG